MSSSNYHQHLSSSLAREQGLRRCFLGTHYNNGNGMSSAPNLSSSPVTNPHQEISGNLSNRSNLGNRSSRRANKESSNTSYHRIRQSGNRTRRATINNNTATPVPPVRRTRCATLEGDVKAPALGLGRLNVPAVAPQDVPMLPFPDSEKYNDVRQDLYVSRPSRQATMKVLPRRPSAPITDDVAHEKVTAITHDKMIFQQQGRRATLNDYWMDADAQPQSVQQQKQQHVKRDSFHQDYLLGQTVRHPSHMTLNPTSQDISSLQKHDFAFIKRSDGTYSYAILSSRFVKQGYGNGEEYMTFVMNECGSTKVIKERHWKEFICLVARNTAAHPKSMKKMIDRFGNLDYEYCQKVEHVPPPPYVPAPAPMPHMPLPIAQNPVLLHGENEDVEPDMIIAFDRAHAADEECSVISSVSCRAMMFER